MKTYISRLGDKTMKNGEKNRKDIPITILREEKVLSKHRALQRMGDQRTQPQ